MSWIDDASLGELRSAGYFEPEIDEEIAEQTERFHVLKNGTKICNNCGSKNIKTSKANNEYCADLCWVKNDEDEACGMTFQDWRTENDHE